MTSLGELLESFERSAWRLEARDEYDISEEREQFDEFLATGRATASEDDLAWQSWLRGVRSSGRSIGRVRLVGRPVTRYTRFEMAYYPDLVAAGEDVQVLDRSKVAGKPGPWHDDFWIFDDERVAVMHYGPRGEFLDAEVLAARDARPYLEVRTEAVALAVALADYHLPEEHPRVA